MPAKKTKASKGPVKARTASKKSIRSKVDDVLVKVSPQVQKRVDTLIATLQDTREARMGDLKWLAGQILLRSREISAQLKSVGEKAVRKPTHKKTSKKTSKKTVAK